MPLSQHNYLVIDPPVRRSYCFLEDGYLVGFQFFWIIQERANQLFENNCLSCQNTRNSNFSYPTARKFLMLDAT